MGYKSGGLSYFSDGSSTNTEEQKPAAFQAKPTAPKGRFGLPTPAGNVPVSQSVLDQMEQLYIQRQANRTGFMESLKDASAWFSGGVEGPHQALLARDKFRQEQEGEDFQMQSQIAQYRSALAAQKAFEERRARELGLGGAPGAAGAAPLSPEAMFGMPPEIKEALASAKTEAEYNKIKTDYAMKKAEVEASPEFDVPKIPVVVKAPDGTYYRDVISARELRANPGKYMRQDEVGAARPQAGAAPPEAAAPKPLPGAQQAPQGAPGAAPQAAAPAPQAAPGAAPAAQGADPYTFDKLTPQMIENAKQRMAQQGLKPELFDRPDAAQLFNNLPPQARQNFFSVNTAPPAAKAPAPAPQAAAPVAPAAPQPAAPVAPAAPQPAAPAARRPTAPELERQGEIEKQVEIQAAQEKLKTDAERRKVFETDIDATKITERQARAKRVQDLIKEDPSIAGVISGPGYQNAIAGLLREGISTPSGSISLSSISDAIYKTLPTTMNTQRRYELAGILANMELDASAVMNGQGQISDGERKILSKSAISIDDAPEVVYKKARLMEARQEVLKKLGDLYGDGSRYTRNFSAFRNDPQYKAIQAQYEKQIEQINNEKVSFAKPAKGKGTARAAAPKPYEDSEKERRYQEWKKSQGM